MRYLVSLFVAGTFISCTEANPQYQMSDLGGVDVVPVGSDGAGDSLVADRGQAAEGLIGEDGAADLPPREDVTSPDLSPDVSLDLSVDVGPRPCTGGASCDDGLSCTEDECVRGQCVSTLKQDHCLIGGRCYEKADEALQNSCLHCDPNANAFSFSAKEDGAECPDDGLSCTDDMCRSGSCVHPRKAEKVCLIVGVCYEPGDPNPQNDCESCQPQKTAEAFSAVTDGDECADDNLHCTNDVCAAGRCTHPIQIGCVVAGQCRPEGWRPTADPCRACEPNLAKDTLSFLDGKPCGIANAGMCVADACRRWQRQPDFTATPPKGRISATELLTVDAVIDGSIWAAGQYEAGKNTGGVLVRLDGSARVQQLTKGPQLDLSAFVSTGNAGETWAFDGTRWSEFPIAASLDHSNRRGAFGVFDAGSFFFYLSGDHEPPQSYGIYSCVSVAGVSGCGWKGVGSNSTLRLGSIIGATDDAGATRLWVLSSGATDDIYSVQHGSKALWSKGGIFGCDGSVAGSPCGNISGDLRAIHASSPSNVWVVGDNNAVLRFDGKGWRRMAPPLGTSLSRYQFTATFASSDRPLVTIVGHRDTVMGRTFAMFNYNRALQRWYGPFPFSGVAATGITPRIHHIGGKDAPDLWMVGVQAAATFSDQPVGWVLKLQ